jgi:diaminohydroxyphosphoribosylaminopyrimidine deaminase/5-amino-6-(5-phosphoribosylamino)uracil reductase
MTLNDPGRPGLDPTNRADERRMDEALALAERARGDTSPNPMVGAIVVSACGEVVGSGFHARAGEPHAEVRALDAASGHTSGATMYCTLEPCCHVGRTGPCTERIVEAGVRRVVIGVVDPNPRVSGSGIAYLRGRGLQVDVGIRRRRASRLNEAFITWITTGRPFVTVKVAMSRDGKIAARPGLRTAITSDEANRVIHGARALVDAIAVGSETVIIDDPRLTVRGHTRTRPLTRVVFDRRLRTPSDARLVRTMSQGPVLVLTSKEAVAARPDAADRLRSQGVRVEVVGDHRLSAALQRLGELEVTSLVLEGGASIHRAAWREGLVDRVQRFRAPMQIGDEGVPWIDDEVVVDDLLDLRTEMYGPDEFTEGYVQRVD